MRDLDNVSPNNLPPNHPQPITANQPSSSFDDPTMSDPNKEGGFVRSLKSLFGSSKKKSDPYQAQHPISTAHDALSSNNPFANSEAAPPSYNEAMSGKPGASSSIPAITVNGNQVAAAPGTIPRRVTLDGKLITDDDDPYAFLSIFDTVFLIDDSSSMKRDARWDEARDALAAIAPICVAHDKDGIDIHFINHYKAKNNKGEKIGYTNITSADEVINTFKEVDSPKGGTLTGHRIRDILKPYLENYTRDHKTKKEWDPEKTGVKPINLIVITDGQATDEPEAEIKGIIKKLDEVDAPYYQVGIQFFQVGNDPGAKRFLAELDDNIRDNDNKKMRDIVDTVTWDDGDTRARQLEGEKLLKVVLGSVIKRLDRRKSDGRG